MNHPTKYQLTEKQISELQAEDSFLRGKQALAILNESVKETGVVIPADYVFKEQDPSVVNKALDATFELIGGIPRMALWAATEPTEFYKLWTKSKAKDQNHIVATGTVNIVSSLPESALDSRSIDDTGFVTAEFIQRDAEDESSD